MTLALCDSNVFRFYLLDFRHPFACTTESAIRHKTELVCVLLILTNQADNNMCQKYPQANINFNPSVFNILILVDKYRVTRSAGVTDSTCLAARIYSINKSELNVDICVILHL